MSKGSVSLIALAVMMVAIAVFVADPSRNGQQAFMALGFLASVIVVIGGLLGASSESGEARNLHVENHIHNHPAAAPMPMAQPIYQPPAAPQIVYIPMPQPSYPPAAGYALPPQHAAPGHLAAAYQAPAMQYQPAPAIERHEPQYRGALDVVAEPVRHAPQRGQLARPALQLESQKSASFIRRVAKRAMS